MPVETRAVRIWVFCALRGRRDRIARSASWGWPDDAEAAGPQMPAGCDVGLDLDGFLSSRTSPVVGRPRGCSFQLQAWRPEKIGRSGPPGMDARPGVVIGC